MSWMGDNTEGARRVVRRAAARPPTARAVAPAPGFLQQPPAAASIQRTRSGCNSLPFGFLAMHGGYAWRITVLVDSHQWPTRVGAHQRVGAAAGYMPAMFTTRVPALEVYAKARTRMEWCRSRAGSPRVVWHTNPALSRPVEKYLEKRESDRRVLGERFGDDKKHEWYLHDDAAAAALLTALVTMLATRVGYTPQMLLALDLYAAHQTKTQWKERARTLEPHSGRTSARRSSMGGSQQTRKTEGQKEGASTDEPRGSPKDGNTQLKKV
ncbi:hypothetical protein B0H19DRAFT_1085874 [Mycena capillaripes]|nr:hypothetical protein B0H19DRAFT_1085874 [Mycena capillaripes]